MLSHRILEIVLMIVSALIGAVFHEAGHALTAYAFGDRTAARAGRLTLNPLKHIDLMTTVIMPVVLLFARIPPLIMFKPVPISFHELKNPRLGTLAISMAGPGANILLALLAVAISRILFPQGNPPDLAGLFIACFVLINLILAAFNLIPIPPLDGSWIVTALLPARVSELFQKVRTTFLIVFLFLMFSGLAGKVLDPFFRRLDSLRIFLLGY